MGIQNLLGILKKRLLIYREYKRFLSIRKSDTGQDPQSAFLKFIKNDPIKPLHRTKPYSEHIEIINTDKWALDTQKKCASPEKLPKIQQFKDYYFPQKSHEQDEKYRTSFINTDHIAISIPKIMKKEENESFSNLKKKFGSHTETSSKGWIPLENKIKSLSNLSSVQYNILSHQQNKTSAAIELKLLDKKLANRKKSIGEIYDLTMNFHPKNNPDFIQTYENNRNIFHIRKGIFSQMYDHAHRNGNISVPFRNNMTLTSIKNK
jgi:hypothetical protein